MAARILVVDDEPYIRELVRETLKSRSFETGVAANGVEALDILSRERFDIMLTDVVMPGMDGLELLKRAKRAHPKLRVIVLTAYPRQSDIGDFLLQGADEFLPKPFRANDLVAAIRKVQGQAPGPAPGGTPLLPGDAPAPGR